MCMCVCVLKRNTRHIELMRCLNVYGVYLFVVMVISKRPKTAMTTTFSSKSHAHREKRHIKAKMPQNKWLYHVHIHILLYANEREREKITCNTPICFDWSIGPRKKPAHTRQIFHSIIYHFRNDCYCSRSSHNSTSKFVYCFFVRIYLITYFNEQFFRAVCSMFIIKDGQKTM